jgi:hypothetical protein
MEPRYLHKGKWRVKVLVIFRLESFTTEGNCRLQGLRKVVYIHYVIAMAFDMPSYKKTQSPKETMAHGIPTKVGFLQRCLS